MSSDRRAEALTASVVLLLPVRATLPGVQGTLRVDTEYPWSDDVIVRLTARHTSHRRTVPMSCCQLGILCPDACRSPVPSRRQFGCSVGDSVGTPVHGRERETIRTQS